MLILLIVNFAYYFTLITAHPQQSIYTVLIFFTLQVFAFSVIEATLKEQRAKEEIGAINQELLATRFMLKESSKKQERLRISRDLHDVLGHQLTALALNLEVTQHKLPNEYKPLAEENLQQAKQLLQGVRNVVKEMRTQEKLDLRSHLNNLFTQLPNCQFAIKSNLKKNSVEIDSLTLNNQLIFCLQEAISNALRHGKANDFTLKFYRDKNHLTFELTDNGKGCNEIIAGNGLKGMQERLSEFNGKIELLTQTNTTTSGCTLRIQVEDNYD
jgi:signal transduction histidine kinase